MKYRIPIDIVSTRRCSEVAFAKLSETNSLLVSIAGEQRWTGSSFQYNMKNPLPSFAIQWPLRTIINEYKSPRMYIFFHEYFIIKKKKFDLWSKYRVFDWNVKTNTDGRIEKNLKRYGTSEENTSGRIHLSNNTPISIWDQVWISSRRLFFCHNFIWSLRTK